MYLGERPKNVRQSDSGIAQSWNDSHQVLDTVEVNNIVRISGVDDSSDLKRGICKNKRRGSDKLEAYTHATFNDLLEFMRE